MIDLRQVKRKIRTRLCKHVWGPITVTSNHLAEEYCHSISAFAACSKCKVARLINRKLFYKSLTDAPRLKDLENFGYVLTGVLAYQLHGKKLTNQQLGWIE